MVANTAPIFVAQPSVSHVTFINSDGTTPKDLIIAGADGTKAFRINATSDDTSDVDMEVYIHDGTSAYLLGTVTVTTLAGTDGSTPAQNLLHPSLIKGLDAAGELFLPTGYKIQVAPTAAVTSAKTVTIIGWAGNYSDKLVDISGWTNFGSPQTLNNTDYDDGSVHFEAAAGANLSGAFTNTSLSFPTTVTLDIMSAQASGNYARAGGIILCSSTSPPTNPLYFGGVWDSGAKICVIRYTGTGSFHSYPYEGTGFWWLGGGYRLRLIIEDSTTITAKWAKLLDPENWTTVLSSYSIWFTAAQLAVGGSDEGATGESRFGRYTES